MTAARDARAEATAVLPEGHEARVLEPSPPAAGPPEFADDPTDPAGATGRIVSPVSTGDLTWAELSAGDDAIAAFARPRWLGPFPDLTVLPAGFADTRQALLRLSLHVVYRMRRRANGKYGLRWTLGGFGTPFFTGDGGDDEQVRVDADQLVHQTGSDARTVPITSLRAAADFVGLDLDPDFDHGFEDVEPAGDIGADLAIDRPSALALADWYGFAWSVLETLRTEEADAAPSRAQLWPEHFDAAIDLAWGSPAGERRANVGFSPGDGFHADPYVYVGPWTADRPGGDELWNASFGATLSYDDLIGPGAEARATALAFVRDRLDALRAID